MKIGYDAKRLFHNFSGLGNYSRNLLQSLTEYFPQHQYHLYTPRLNDVPELHAFSTPPIYTHTAGIGPSSFWRSVGIKRDLQDDGIQLYHGLSHEIPFNLQGTGIKTIVTIHDLIFKIYPKHYPLIQRQIYDFKCRYACEHADSIIAISEQTKNDIIRIYGVSPEKIKVIYQSCDPAFRAPTKETVDTKKIKGFELPEQYLLYVGTITERKNLLNLVRAIKRLPADVQLPLLVVGRGKAYKVLVQRYLAAHQLESRVIFLKNINTPELVVLYQRATMLVYPSNYEGFGIPVIEALSCGTPVITSAFASLPEAGGKGALYLQDLQPETICSAIVSLLSDEELRQQLGRDGLEYVKRFDRKAIATQMEAHYQQISDQGNG